jgi:hypothetical protein
MSGRSRRSPVRVATVLLALAALALLVPSAAIARTPTAGTGASAGIVPHDAANNTSWQNLSDVVGPAPSDRSISQAAFSPALNETILFGGYNGVGGNFALNDTWSFANNTWTELFPATFPSPRWGATLVYDPAIQALVTFGGRDATAFFNDTWEFNATGWHNVTPPVAPSPRYDYGMAYDAQLGAVVLFGGGIGNVPAGTFTNFTFYNDTWTFQHGHWTNITASVGPAPPGRLLQDQMAYDAADGVLVLTGGYTFDALGSNESCGYQYFDPNWSGTWQFSHGSWSEVPVTGPSPPLGIGDVWFDTEANVTLYYEGVWLASGLCDSSGNQVWTYSAGNWTLVTEGNLSAPPPVTHPVFVDDEADHEQLVFGGELAATASEYYAAYLNDTWAYQPTWLTFRAADLPAGDSFRVAVSGTVGALDAHPIVFVEAPGRYTYQAVLTRGATPVGTVEGNVTLTHGPASIVLRGTVPAPSTPPAPGGFLSMAWPAFVGLAVGALALAAAGGVSAVRRRQRLRAEGERLVSAMVEGPPNSPPRSPR